MVIILNEIESDKYLLIQFLLVLSKVPKPLAFFKLCIQVITHIIEIDSVSNYLRLMITSTHQIIRS